MLLSEKLHNIDPVRADFKKLAEHAEEYEEKLFGLHIAVHSAPRTGSSSMSSFLVDGLNKSVIHVHGLMNRWYPYYTERKKERILEIGKDLFKAVTIVRDPVARNISDYVQFNPEASRNGFLAEVDHTRGVRHIGAEFEAFWGLNIFTEGFRPPYTIYKNRFMIIRFEDLIADSTLARRAVKQWLGKDIDLPFPHQSKNRRKNYQQEFPLPARYVEHMMKLKYTRMFYSSSEIEKMKNRWLRQEALDKNEDIGYNLELR